MSPSPGNDAAGAVIELEGHVVVSHLVLLAGSFHAHAKVFEERPASLLTARGALCRLSSGPHADPAAAREAVREQALAFILARKTLQHAAR